MAQASRAHNPPFVLTFTQKRMSYNGLHSKPLWYMIVSAFRSLTLSHPQPNCMNGKHENYNHITLHLFFQTLFLTKAWCCLVTRLMHNNFPLCTQLKLWMNNTYFFFSFNSKSTVDHWCYFVQTTLTTTQPAQKHLWAHCWSAIWRTVTIWTNSLYLVLTINCSLCRIFIIFE